MKKRPEINEKTVIEISDHKFLKMFDIQYAQGRHYFNASRRNKEDLMCLKSDEEFKKALPDAVTCIVIVKLKDKDERLLLSEEYRYPAGRFLLSPPAGVLDPSDKDSESPIINAAIREIKEETGLRVDISGGDTVKIVNPLLFSSPGMTDESNAIVCVYINDLDETKLSQSGTEESELFNGFRLLDKEAAKRIIRNGYDDEGYFYSVYTFVALSYFISC
ncbi:MAG: NUDIX hydrolase [Lachnospiraceae bacterium]|nr:NUDIX hydrolase [Lachnospiraceae bacterium]